MARFGLLAILVVALAAASSWFVLQRPVRTAEVYRQIVTVHAALSTFPLLAALGALGASRSYRTGDRERGVWRTIALACVLWAAGRGLFGYTQIVGGNPLPFPSAADAFTAAFFVLFLAAVYAEYAIVRELVTWRQTSVVAAVALGALALGYWSFLRPVLGGGLAGGAEAVSVAFSLMGIVLIPLALIPATVFLGGLEGYVWLLIAAAIVCLALAVMWFSHAVFFGEWFVGHRSNILQIGGFALLTVGALWHRSIMREA
ncbi:MAG: hypothetical protein QN163_08710 [Armatimonadota bacterium]|nr:hypothetical protein [Armatimonadota bacterium]MDR5696579.1 hypothetical protein [Armatimonadota bacterium]